MLCCLGKASHGLSLPPNLHKIVATRLYLGRSKLEFQGFKLLVVLVSFLDSSLVLSLLRFIRLQQSVFLVELPISKTLVQLFKNHLRFPLRKLLAILSQICLHWKDGFTFFIVLYKVVPSVFDLLL